MTDTIFVFYTPHRSMPRNMPGVLKVQGWGNEVLQPGENYKSEKFPDNLGNPVSIPLASLLLEQHSNTVHIVDEADLLKIKAYRDAKEENAKKKAPDAKDARKAAREEKKRRTEAILKGEIKPGEELPAPVQESSDSVAEPAVLEEKPVEPAKKPSLPTVQNKKSEKEGE